MNSKALLAKNLRLLMERNPSLASQQALAKRSGVAQGTISHMLDVEYPSWPKLDSIEMVAKAFGLAAANLLDPCLHSAEATRFGASLASIHTSLSHDPERLQAFMDAVNAAAKLAGGHPSLPAK